MIIADFGAEIEMPVFYACFREKRSGIHDILTKYYSDSTKLLELF